MVESCWRGPCDELGGSKHTQPQCIGNLHTSVLRNNIRRRQNAETMDITGNALSIASVSTEQLVNIRSGRKLKA